MRNTHTLKDLGFGISRCLVDRKKVGPVGFPVAIELRRGKARGVAIRGCPVLLYVYARPCLCGGLCSVLPAVRQSMLCPACIDTRTGKTAGFGCLHHYRRAFTFTHSTPCTRTRAFLFLALCIRFDRSDCAAFTCDCKEMDIDIDIGLGA